MYTHAKYCKCMCHTTVPTGHLMSMLLIHDMMVFTENVYFLMTTVTFSDPFYPAQGPHMCQHFLHTQTCIHPFIKESIKVIVFKTNKE